MDVGPRHENHLALEEVLTTVQRRSDNIRRSTRAQLDERVVYDEAGLIGALLDIASREATVRSILLAERIDLTQPCYLGPEHDGLILRGLGLNTGLFASSAVGAALQSASSGLPSFSVENMTVQGLVLGSGGEDYWPGVRFDRVRFTGDITVDAVKDVSFNNCVVSPDYDAEFTDCFNCAIQGSMWACTTTLSGNSGFMVEGNRILGGLTMPTANLAVIINSNTFTGAVNTSAGGGGSTVVGNYRNGNSLTTHGSDTVASNHA